MNMHTITWHYLAHTCTHLLYTHTHVCHVHPLTHTHTPTACACSHTWSHLVLLCSLQEVKPEVQRLTTYGVMDRLQETAASILSTLLVPVKSVPQLLTESLHRWAGGLCDGTRAMGSKPAKVTDRRCSWRSERVVCVPDMCVSRQVFAVNTSGGVQCQCLHRGCIKVCVCVDLVDAHRNAHADDALRITERANAHIFTGLLVAYRHGRSLT